MPKTEQKECDYTTLFRKRFKYYRWGEQRKMRRETFLLVILSLFYNSPGVLGQITQSLRKFPPLFNVAQNKPVITEPSDSTCGTTVRNAFCKSSTFPISVDQCVQDFCVQTCPGRTLLPSYYSLLPPNGGFSDCIVADTVNIRPGSLLGSFSTYFLKSGPSCFLTPTIPTGVSTSGEFTITVWMWQEENNKGTLLQKISQTTGEIILEFLVERSGPTFRYRSTLGLATVTFKDEILPKVWKHLAIQVTSESISFFINGIGPSFSAAYTTSLVSQLQDESPAWVRVGQTLSGTDQFLGRIQDFHFYEVALSNREIAEDYSGFLPELRVQSSCRCPSAYPRESPLKVHYCIKNGVPDNTENYVLRLNVETHPVEYVNDGDSNSVWISKFQNQANVIIDLGDEFQVFYVVIQFYSPFPKAVKIERLVGTMLVWDTWQMYAEDCMTYFSISNDGPLPTPASVNCLKFPSQTPYSKGNITLNILSSEPVARPGYNDFYNTPELYQFVKAKKIRIQMNEHYYIKNERHEYYGLYEVIISGRCDCNGHAETCNYTSLPYKCNCSEESHTEGRMCERCMPLFNDKPFRHGDNINLFPCRPCDCYGHADSCVYNITLDPFPNDHFSGGGGICVVCKHNTIGRFCDTCINLYYRPLGKSKYDVDVCTPCDCFVGGVKNNNMDCQKDGGQCQCKLYVGGRQCSTCATGYYNLTADKPDGCIPCGCHMAGTQNEDISCHPTTGMCNCKVNVRNDKCDECQFGYYNLSVTNTQGCSPCNCNPLGSTSQFCDPVSGQCQCKDNIIGQLCDTCTDGYYDFWGLCRRCDCDPKGTELNTFCDKQTGQCQCKANVHGLQCDRCKEKSYGFGQNQRTGCINCTCDTAGTVIGSNFCDNVTGECVCKSKVQGNNCNICKPNTWGLNATNAEGCIPCNCNPSGTQNGNISDPQSLPCDQNTGQCTCLAHRWGRQCDDCRDGYYVNPSPGGGCFTCDCDDVGTIPQTYCNTKTGQCQCRGGNSGVAGKSCNQCMPGYYGFQPVKGICSPCDCVVAGSKNLTCNSVTGQCQCKEFVTGRSCDICVSGTSFLDAGNSYGCSKAPAQQPPPYHEPLGPTTLSLHWEPPDNPNGVIKSYKLYRNRTLIFTVGGNERKVNDTGLIPYTVYEYIIEASNAFGSVNSSPVAYRTLAGPPSGIIYLNITNIRSKSASFSWDEPAMRNGPYLKYKLLAQTTGSAQTKLLWEGTTTDTYVSTLIPFTNYSFYVNACTEGGCLQSKGYTASTQSSVPEGMRAPNITTISSSELYIEWSPPDQPNGIIIFYELWMRGTLGPDGIRNPPETRIFHPSGQYNPRPTLAPEENTLPAPVTNFTAGGLEPFTVYDFQVLAENDAGKAASSWVSGRTGEALPVSMPTPGILSVSSLELNITWRAPSASEALGIVSLYRVHYYKKTNLTTFPYAPPYMWTLIYNTTGSENFYVLRGLTPYSNHTFKIEACNSIGCINSTAAMGRTQQAVPEGLSKPVVSGYNSTVMEITWLPPAFPNGPGPEYTVEKTIPALSYPPQVIRGTRFPGGGYYLFPPDIITPNVPFTGVQFWFRTRERDGLLLFGASEGKQEEFIALQFKAGRPWFIFDPQGCPTFVQLDPLNDKLSTLTFDDGEWHSLYVLKNETFSTLVVDGRYTGCVSFVTPTNDEGLSYNDNLWHRMLVWRNETTAYISVDETWTGTRQSFCAQGTVIGPLTGVYIGGIPANFEIRREDKDPRIQPISFGFQGCIRDIQIMTQKFPTEIWKTLDWNDAITNELAFLNWEGCPINLDRGIHFMGQGFAKFSTNAVQIGNNKEFKFGFRTQMHTGILFFSYGGQGVYIYAALIKGSLHFEFASGIYVGGATFNRNDVNLCDSHWYTVQLIKKGQQATITIDGIGTETKGDPNVIMSVYIMSEFYIGGIPPNAEASRFIKENKLNIPGDAFGGCIRDFTQDNFVTLNFLTDTIEVVNVNMDGCTPFHLVQETCIDDLIHQVYKGNKTQVYDVGLDPYTNYLYHVQATNMAGTATSQWGYGRTKEGAPIGMLPPSGTHPISGYIVEVTWRPPISTAGLLTRYELQGYNLDNTTVDPIIIIITNTSMLIGNLTKTIPYTLYKIKIVACTQGGCASHQDGLIIRTNEEAPENVATPTAEAGPSYLIVKWGPPANPNGPITGYFLFQDDVLIYSGGEKFFNVTNLQVYTAYRFYVRTCTRIGCTNGSTVALSTAQLPPTYMKPPRLIALGTQRVETRWEQPEQLNGVLQRYILYASVNKSLIGEEVYNNTDFFLDYVIPNLTAGTTYYIRVAACTGGGCRVSESSNVTTQESAPEGVQPPVVTSPSSTELNVTWMEPPLPNGKIIQYELYHNEVPTYKGMAMNYLIGGLRPYSLNSLRVAACTSRGCGSSTLIQFRTQEAPPVGFVVMEMTVNNSRIINVRWTQPESLNGDLFYDVFAEGLFYADVVHWNYTTVSHRRSMYHGKIHSQWVEVSPLIPMSSYLIQINASNSAGFILSNELTAVMPPGTPDGVKPPNLISQTPTTITTTWSAVGRKNSAEDPQYVLQFREIILGAQVLDVFGPTTAFTYTKENLVSFKEYEFRLVASNTHGSSFSEWVSQVTRQDRPIGVDAPLIAGVGRRHIDIIWTPPLTPNGIVMQYKIYQNNVFRETVLGNLTLLRTDELLPYTSYAFNVEACTLGGCTRSTESARVRTLEDIPEGIYEPLGVSRTPTSVEIRWSEPSMPNGVISLYSINRRLNGTGDFITVTTVAASAVMAYVDESSELSPYTSYQYQLAVTNGAGVGYSPWVTVTTKSTRPSGVMAPLVRILSPTVMNVSWEPPLHPNGLIEFYAVQLPEQRLEIRNTSQTSILFTDLVPYTEYRVTLTVCTGGGCTESPPVLVRTHAMVPEGQFPPTATPVSQSIISVVWQRPSRPNGPNIQYELSRMKTRQPLDPSATGFNLWERVYKGTSTVFEDRGLTMYTTYRYRVTVYNDVGQMTSEPTANVSTFGGFPRQAAVVTGYAINHLSIAVSWITPNEVELQGNVTEYTIKAMSNQQNFTQTVSPGTNINVIQNLTPNTDYRISVTITINGGAAITSEPIIIHTKDGAPEGLNIPTLSIISETTLRVSWKEPDVPNGEIIGYNIYVSGKKIETGMVYAGSYVIKDLLPYTVYTIQLEVCTVFVCVKSAEVLGTTVEALPQGVASPRAVPISATNIHVMWTQPYQPNGIILRYDLYRKYITQCSQIPTTTPSPEVIKCTFTECGILENLCGTTCYSGGKVCCDGVLYANKGGYDCCDTQYVPRSLPEDVCCGGKFHTRMENYQCCGQRYEKVPPSQVCCPDQLEDRVAIGYGDACCGSIPYSSHGAQICCADKLHSAYQQQCCGREVVSDLMICCGGLTDGQVFTPRENMTCCGHEYVEKYSTLCCTADTGHSKAHHYSSPDARFKANEKCCGLEKISNSLSCCNFVGYNPLTHVCADVSHYQDGCGTGTVCPLRESGTAFCDRCNFNQSAYMCGSVSGHFDPQANTVPTPSPTDNCVVSVNRIYSGLDMDYIDKELTPYSHYEYAISAVNGAGSTQSNFTSTMTQQAQPQGLAPPIATVDPKKLYVIYLRWKLPEIPNGEILRFILTRDGIELYRGLDTQYSDDTNIMPFRSYTYMLSACTVAGCETSGKIVIATAQAPPEDMLPPKLVVINDTTIQASWTPPGKPNGIIQLYTFWIFGANQSKAMNTTDLSITVTGLQPYSKYSAIVQVCTDVGCTRSANVTIKTPEGRPEGVDPPFLLVASSTSVDIFWSPPKKPNGEILFYGIIRSDQTKEEKIYMGKGDNFHMSDYGLTPGATYQYFLHLGNSVGNTSSGSSAVTMPYRLPSNIPPPKNVTVLSATEIYVEWNHFSSSEGFIDQYRVLLNPGRPNEVSIGVGFDLSRKVIGLTPFTTYDVRIQGCLQGQPIGCGSSPGIVVQTHEAPPVGLAGPYVESVASDVVDVSWGPPKFPNGIITQYLVYYQTPGSGIELLINRVDGETFQVRHAGPELKPFFEYEYKVVGGNSRGDVSSSWTRVRTLEAPPTGLPLPLVTVTGAFSANLQWQHPAQLNGIITKYTVVYRIVERDPTVPMVNLSLSVGGNTANTSISGLRPYADYQLQLQAFNGAGSTTTSWINFKTDEASPSGLGLFDIEKIDTGTSAILRWGAPVHPNGVIITYRIYEGESSVAVFQGLNQQFELRRLQPYTDYTVQLEACTTAGCTRSVPQTFRSAEIPPTDQSSPLIGKVTSNTVTLTWTRPGNANGQITMYEVLRKSSPRIQKRSVSDPLVIYRTTDTAAGSYQYIDTSLQPFTEYQYSIRAVNSQGSTQSLWQTVFTEHAPPDGVDPPVVTYLDSTVNALNIKWMAPLKPNGIIQSYQLQRNGSVLFSFSPLDKKEFNDTGLTAYTWYSYSVTVCSGGGCTTSDPTLFRTKESAPFSVAPPTVVAINSTAIRVTWEKPQMTNGEISIYQLKMDGTVVFEGLELLYVLGKLMPYHEYNFRLVACTKGGCVESGTVTGRTEDASPQGILPPILRVMSATSIEVSWLPPKFPNGIITSYDLRRDGRLIYTESISSTGFLRNIYTDYSLNPGTEYSYVVTARNRKGNTESPPSLALTFSSSPSGLDPPTLHPLTATSIQAIWRSPLNPNGVIKNYTLYRDGEKVYAGGPEQLSYIVPGLQFWTEYSFRVQACTDRGCELSTPASARTLEARPEGQGSPQLRALADQNGAHTGVLVTWESPLKPNGIVKTYEVYRRQLIREDIGVSYGPTKLVYNGSQLQYTDQSEELQPFMDYQYSVTSVNSNGKVTSIWETVQTKQASPAAVLPPVVVETTVSTISVTITPPAVPNGVVYNYNVLVNGTVSSQGTSLFQTVGVIQPLAPYTVYSLVIQACTAGGCTTSPRVISRTQTDHPAGQEPVRILDVNSTSVKLAWSHPTRPNGQITRFLLYQQVACPPTSQPFEQSCVTGQPKIVYEGLFIEVVITGLSVYTAYEFQVVSATSAGTSDFPLWVRVETGQTDPEYVKFPVLKSNSSITVIDWSLSFMLNGRLKEYILLRDEQDVFRGVETHYELDRVNKNTVFKLTIKAITARGQAESPLITFDPSTAINTGVTASSSGQGMIADQGQMFYKEVWFIVLIVIAALILLFLLCALCIRRATAKRPYIRERLPLQTRQKKSEHPFTFCIDNNDGSIFTTENQRNERTALEFYDDIGVRHKGVVNPAFASGIHLTSGKVVGLDKRSTSTSQFDNENDKDDDDEFLWEETADSGLYDDDMDSLRTPSYSITKEQTVFTDTHL